MFRQDRNDDSNNSISVVSLGRSLCAFAQHLQQDRHYFFSFFQYIIHVITSTFLHNNTEEKLSEHNLRSSYFTILETQFTIYSRRTGSFTHLCMIARHFPLATDIPSASLDGVKTWCLI